MLPVAHQAWTLAPGALRSSVTISLNPSGRTHFVAVLGGNVMTSDSSTEAGLQLTMVNTIAYTSAGRGAFPIIQFWSLANFSELQFFSQARTASQTLPENRKPL